MSAFTSSCVNEPPAARSASRHPAELACARSRVLLAALVLLPYTVMPDSVWAQVPGRELTVEESVRLGLEHNARLRAARADADAARSLYRQVRASLFPALASQASYTRLSGNIPGVEFTLPGLDSTFTFQGVQLNRYHAEVSVEQTLLPIRLRSQIRAAAHDADAAALFAEQEQADVALEIRRAYWNLFRALAVRASVETALTHVDEHLRDVRNQLAAGTALNRDLLAAQTRRAEVRLEQVEAENAVRVGQLELNRLIGLPLDSAVRPVRDVVLDTSRVALPSATATALSERPQLNALAQQVGGRRAELNAARGERLPELAFIGRYVYARPNPYFFAEQDQFRGTWELGVNARWSVFAGGRVSARAGEAQARLAAAEARLTAAREQVMVDVARQHLEVLRAAEAVAVAAQNVTAAEETFRVARQQYDEGAALSADVLDAEQALRRAQARRAQSLADHALARASLLNAQGQVW